MITAGIDMGSKNIKVLIIKDGQVAGKGMMATGLDQAVTASECINKVLQEAGIQREMVDHFTSTGAGRKSAPGVDSDITDVGADARGVIRVLPEVRTVVDVGAEEGRGIKIAGDGKVLDFAVNEKCAAGAGAFAESMSRALEVSLAEFGQISLESDKQIPMNAQCTVFAESEVVSLLHAQTPKQDISRAVHDAIASRVSSMVRRVGVEQKIALVGGVAYNPGFVASLKRALESDLIIPEDPEYIGALGAAVVAGERSGSN